jgi:hypothetical protein
MKYNYTINQISKSITIRTSGYLETKEFSEMCVSMHLKAIEFKCLLILDCRLSKNLMSAAEAYYCFSDHYNIVDFRLREIPTAIITSIEDMDFFYFLETTCLKKGIKIKAFLDEKSSIDWLVQSTISTVGMIKAV